MAITPVVPILPRLRRRSTYRHRWIQSTDVRPAAHRSDHRTPTPMRLAAIRRRRARVLAVQGWVSGNARYIVAGIGSVAVFAATTVFMLGLTDPRACTLIAAGGIVLFAAISLDQIARHVTEEQDK